MTIKSGNTNMIIKVPTVALLVLDNTTWMSSFVVVFPLLPVRAIIGSLSKNDEIANS
jgi:hypothetical protein